MESFVQDNVSKLQASCLAQRFNTLQMLHLKYSQDDLRFVQCMALLYHELHCQHEGYSNKTFSCIHVS